MRLVALLTFWAVGLGIGFHAMLNYQLSPGLSGHPPDDWQKNSLVELDADRPTLLVFAHPKCPCTTATIAELERLLAITPGLVSTHVVFFKPTDMDDSWAKTDLWQRAKAIPTVTTVFDPDGHITEQFQAETSGTAVLYGTDGQRVFHGGITSSRGHEGDNSGATAIRSFLMGNDAVCESMPVFGCALLDSNSNRPNE